MNVGRWMLIGCYVATMLGLGQAIPEHFGEPDWPIHAHNHLMQTLFWIEGFCGLGIILVLVPLKQAQGWAIWATVAAGIFIYGGYFLGVLLTGGGAPGLRDDIFFAVIWALHNLGAALCWYARRGLSATEPVNSRT